MTTDPQPARSAGLLDEGEPLAADLVPVAARPLDLFHDEMMAKAAADHEKRMAAGQADRAAVLREEAARIRAHCPDHLDSDSAEGAWLACHCAVADDMERRLAAGTPQPETQAAPRRGDAVEQWLKTQRDAAADYPEAYQATDGLLDLYRLHADTGTPLGEHVCEGQAVGDCDCLEQPAAFEAEIVHACPPDGSGLTPCCGRTPFELPLGDRISSEAPVTCPAPAVTPPGKEA
jgi:hypothetical protein